MKVCVRGGGGVREQSGGDRGRGRGWGTAPFLEKLEMATKTPQQAKGRMTARRSSISRGREESGGGCAVCDAGNQFFLGGNQRRRVLLLLRAAAAKSTRFSSGLLGLF